jgi:predicted ATPase
LTPCRPRTTLCVDPSWKKPGMLTRLRVTGFKNLLDVDVYFGPFTCVAGANATGKSNLFDAIQFLSALADRPLLDAAQSVRAAGKRATDVDSLFFRAGGESLSEMSFAAEMIVPGKAVDDLGQPARPSITFLSYRLDLARRQGPELDHLGPLEILKEELSHINLGEAHKHLPFPHRAATWRRSAVTGSRRVPFISTEGHGGNRVVTLHQDGRGGGPRAVSARSLPRTVVSAANAAEEPTALVARREMQSWRLLHLEPASLREPDDFRAPTSLGSDGSHLAATLAYLAGSGRRPGSPAPAGSPGLLPEQVYDRVAARLAELAGEVGGVWVDADEKRELLTLMAGSRAGTAHAARALSDGTLRFLALAVLELDPRATGLLCLEEPENGIHPARIPAMLRLLRDIPVDVDQEVGPDNPPRQVIVNTHSPAVVSQVPDASLLIAAPHAVSVRGRTVQSAGFGCLSGTWREAVQQGLRVASRAELLSYLDPIQRPDAAERGERSRRVADREDPQPLLPYSAASEN